MALRSFHKYAGCGNDFILFDNRSNDFPLCPQLLSSLCDRRNGIGADGVLLCEKSSTADAKMRIFNSDGSEAEMCGNGLRCFFAWLNSQNLCRATGTVEVDRRVLQVVLTENGVCIEMGSPSHCQWNIPFAVCDQRLIGHHLNTGVPHTVIFVPHLLSVDVQAVGSTLRHQWLPNGTNVTFSQILSPQKIAIRTFERGVEGETPACGTGAAAAALAAAHISHCSSPLVVETASKEELTVDFSSKNGIFSNVALTGPAKQLFRGEIDLASNWPYSLKSVQKS